MIFFFNDTATTEIYTLSLHDALPILQLPVQRRGQLTRHPHERAPRALLVVAEPSGLRHLSRVRRNSRSEEHTSELQSRQYLVCRLLLEKKTVYKKKTYNFISLHHTEY